jgi:SAM-dependent methyltransferase
VIARRHAQPPANIRRCRFELLDVVSAILPGMKSERDAYGSELMAVYEGKKNTFEVVERDDHFIGVSTWPGRYFSEYAAWSRLEKAAMRFVKGRVLDIGCGAGRHGLYLQEKGFGVTGIDNSPGAIKVCRLRGYRKLRLLSITGIGKFRSESFDTVIMMGNNFGLFGGFKSARRLLKQLYRITSADGQIIAETRDPYRTKDRLHLGYHQFNRKRGRMGGQLRIRVRHKNIIGEWFDYLLVSQTEMAELLSGTGWMIKQILADKGSAYTAVIAKRA